jgi:hypothetical protein
MAAAMFRQGARRLAATACANAKLLGNPGVNSRIVGGTRQFASEASESKGGSYLLPILGIGAIGGGLWYANANGYFGGAEVRLLDGHGTCGDALLRRNAVLFV